MSEINPINPIGQVSVDATLLAKRLTIASVGEVLPYPELSSLIGRSVQQSAYHILQTARSIVMRESKIVFGTVPSIGIKRLSDEEIADSYHAPVTHIRRTANKAGRVVACSDTSKLTPEKQRSVSAGLSIVGAIALFSSSKSIAKANSAALTLSTPSKIDVKQLAELFAK